MNIVIEAGRLTRDPEISYSSGQNGQFCVARYTLAVDGARNANGEQHTDFIKCVAFGRTAEFAEKHLHKGMKILINAHLSTGSYTNREGKKVYTTDVVVDSQEFCESKRNSGKQDDYGNPPVSGGYDGNTSPTGSGYAGNVTNPTDFTIDFTPKSEPGTYPFTVTYKGFTETFNATVR